MTPKAGGKVDENQVTQFGRALKELGIKMIPAYSLQARGRMERTYRTWQGRLPQELRLRKITTVEKANQYRLIAGSVTEEGVLCNGERISITVENASRLTRAVDALRSHASLPAAGSARDQLNRILLSTRV